MGKKINNDLTVEQADFCKLYVTKEFFGNGTEAYIEAYSVDVSKKGAYEAARSSASRLLTKANILNRINELLDNEGLNNEFVDKQLLFVLTQNADFGAKIQAIKEYNKIKNRITDKLELSGGLKNFIIELTNEADSQTDTCV
jgi:phage terminase small subunit